jgi:hypothetical protein
VLIVVGGGGNCKVVEELPVGELLEEVELVVEA